MPIVLADPGSWDAWLDPASPPDELRKMLRPADDDLLEVFAVTRDLLRIKTPDASVLSPVAYGADSAGD
jgi:putative SOS response-associated peptidase YedK